MRDAIGILPVWVLLLSGASAPSDPVTAEQAAAIDRIFADQVEPDSPGCILGLIRGSSVVHWRGYGRADVETAVPFTLDTVFGIGSIYKHFYAASVLVLVRDGRLSLSDSIRRYLPELPDYAARITVRQLLDHTHGLREYFDLLPFAPGTRHDDEAAALRLLARQSEPAARPGERFRYGNTGPLLAGQIIERISGETAARFTARRVFDPAGLRSTALADDGRRVPPRIAGYVRQPSGSFTRREPSLGYRSTLPDLTRWNGVFDTSNAGWQWVLRQVSAPSRLANGTVLDYGLGLRLSPHRELRRIWHPGAGPGHRAIFMRFPDVRLTIALACNREINPITAAESVADIVLAREIADRRSEARAAAKGDRPRPLTPADQRILSGTYVSDTGHVVRVARHGRALRLLFDGVEHDLLPAGRRRFTIAGRPSIPRDPVNDLVFSPARGHGTTTLEVRTNWYPVTFRAVEAADPALVDGPSYVGTYHSDEVESSLRVFLRDGKLVAEMPQAEHVLEPVARDLFRAGPQTIRFTRKNGRVAAAVISRGAIPRLPFTRV